MSGHSHWATIKHKKGATDAKRGQLFTKLAREVTVAARAGGEDPDMNASLRLAVQNARDNSMPMDNIERAIKRGIGEGDAGSLEEALYEGYGPGGVAIMLQALTDNKQRTVSDIRASFNKAGGNLGETGCVSWNFEFKGVITAEIEDGRVDEIALAVIDAGADDFRSEGSYLEVYTSEDSLDALRTALQSLDVNVTSSEMSMVPLNTISLEDKVAGQTLRLIDHLEDLDDIQKVYTNADFSVEFLEQFSG
jgi:YebC/PmpR family DNA-binding regulatory protein